MMYVYNNSNYPIIVDDVKTDIKEDGSCSLVGIGSRTATFAPRSWTPTLDFEQSSFNRSYARGKIRNLIDKGYLRVLTSEEYKQEMKKSQREKDLAIPNENSIPQGLGIYAKAIKDVKENPKYVGLIEDDEVEEPEIVEEEHNNKVVSSASDERLDKLENAILSLSSIVKDLIDSKDKPARKKQAKKSVKKSVKKVSKKKTTRKSK